MTLLSVHDLSAFYGDFQALFGVDFQITRGETKGQLLAPSFILHCANYYKTLDPGV